MRACVCSLVKGRGEGGVEEERGKGGRRKGWRRGEGKGWKGKWHECVNMNTAIFERK